ncbi:hypothetical protein DPMN_111829 [Dreissena polymorpha]|uniref:Uncharacterized protein n=1 Tax=Dreissena polymorpha TaxID=45954 RepID=A0A9D4KF58_DREPO|nr:hypothetical protein DPMN_111829 [Dreissena polymorpha]
MYHVNETPRAIPRSHVSDRLYSCIKTTHSKSITKQGTHRYSISMYSSVLDKISNQKQANCCDVPPK